MPDIPMPPPELPPPQPAALRGLDVIGDAPAEAPPSPPDESPWLYVPEAEPEPAVETIPSTGASPIGLATELDDLARRLRNGEIDVPGYRSGMTSESALAALLAALLDRRD